MAIALTTLRRRARADQWLLSGVKKALPFNRVYQSIVGAGFGYRRTEMLRRWHDLEGFAANLATIEIMYVDKPIPHVRHLHPEGDIGDFKRYRTETTLQHVETGEEIKEPFTILSDKPLSLEDIYADARDHLPKYPYIEEYVIVDVTLTEATQRRW